MRRRLQYGFTLLEVLIALAILGIGIAVALSAISGSLGNIRKVQLRARSVQHAETVMELALLDDSIRGMANLHGDFPDGTTWTVQVVEVPGPPPPEPTPGLTPQAITMPVKLLAYTVEVTEPGSRAVDFRLQTLKLVSAINQNMPGSVGMKP